MKSKIIIGTIGHVDHGKTTLTAALVSILKNEPKKIKIHNLNSIEEPERGIRIVGKNYKQLDSEFFSVSRPRNERREKERKNKPYKNKYNGKR